MYKIEEIQSTKLKTLKITLKTGIVTVLLFTFQAAHRCLTKQSCQPPIAFQEQDHVTAYL